MSTDAPSAAAGGARVRVDLPGGVTARLDGDALVVRGPHGEVRRKFPVEMLSATAAAGGVELALRRPSQRKAHRALLHTWERHVANQVRGVTVGFEARLKIVAAHFPMKVQVKGHSLVIENFLGEKYPRTAPLTPDVEAKVDGEVVTVAGADIERVGQAAATIERTTRIRDYDPRVFQDGIYIVEKARPREAAA